MAHSFDVQNRHHVADTINRDHQSPLQPMQASKRSVSCRVAVITGSSKTHTPDQYGEQPKPENKKIYCNGKTTKTPRNRPMVTDFHRRERDELAQRDSDSIILAIRPPTRPNKPVKIAIKTSTRTS